MKNKIIISILIILLSISCRKSNDITGGGNGGNNGGNNGVNNGGNNGENNNENIRFTKDNFETPQTNTKEAEDYLIKFREYSAKYSKAELLSYIYHSGFIETSDYSKYYFDENANLTNILNKEVNYKFWGMLPEDTKIALYYKENNGTYSLYEKALIYDYEKGLIKS